MRDLEHKLQVQCVEYFRWRYSNSLIFAVPNGAQRNIIIARKLKAEGVLAGIPDLIIPKAKGGFHGLFIEMKNGKQGRLSDNQKRVITILQKEGYKCEVARNFDDFKKIVDEYMNAE